MVVNKSNKDVFSPENCAIVGGTVWQCSSTTLRAHAIITVLYFQVWRSFLSRDLLYISFFHFLGSSIHWPIHSLCIYPLLCTTLSLDVQQCRGEGRGTTYWLHSLLAEGGGSLMKHHGSVLWSHRCNSLESGDHRGKTKHLAFYLFRRNKTFFSITTLQMKACLVKVTLPIGQLFLECFFFVVVVCFVLLCNYLH